jgi:hypothetical protein
MGPVNSTADERRIILKHVHICVEMWPGYKCLFIQFIFKIGCVFIYSPCCTSKNVSHPWMEMARHNFGAVGNFLFFQKCTELPPSGAFLLLKIIVFQYATDSVDIHEQF